MIKQEVNPVIIITNIMRKIKNKKGNDKAIAKKSFWRKEEQEKIKNSKKKKKKKDIAEIIIKKTKAKKLHIFN